MTPTGKARPRDGSPDHGHHLILLDADFSGCLYGCRDCPSEWRGPISMEALEDVECEEQEREAA